MNFLSKRPSIKFLLVYIPGILESRIFVENSQFVFFLLVVSTVLVSLRWFQFSIPVIFFCAGILNTVVFQPLPRFNPNLEKSWKTYSAVVEKVSQRYNRVEYRLNLFSEKNVYALYRVEDSLHVEPGDTLILNGFLKKPRSNRNPGAFNYRKFLENKGIHWLVSSKSTIIDIIPGKMNFNRLCFKIRTKVQTIFTENVNEPYSGTLMALLFGEKGELELDVMERFRVLGIVHILAVSGLHVGFIFLILNLLSKIIRLTPGWRTLFISSGLILYMGVTGFPDSVIRAGILGILYVFGAYRQKKTDIWNLLGWGALIMLFIDPRSLYNVGFQLSFGAVTGIIYVFNQYSGFVSDNHFLSRNRSIKYMVDGLVVSVGAMLGTFLPVAIHFHEMPLVGPIVNLAALPLTFLIIISGVLTAVSGLIFPAIANVYGSLAFGFCWSLDQMTRILYELEIPVFLFGGWTKFEIISTFIFLILLFSVNQNRYQSRVVISMLCVMNIFLWGDVIATRQARITFLDVGQGDACVIESNDKTILIDAGYTGFGLDVGRTVILPFLKYRGIDKIDLAIFSHPHADHIGGFLYLTDHIEIKSVWDTKNKFDSKLYQKIKSQFKKLNTNVEFPVPGDIFKFGDMSLKILYPDSTIIAEESNINDASLVLKTVHFSNSILFLGDCELSAEKILLNFSRQLDADIVKVGHHGSKTSSKKELVVDSSADIAVVSVGEGNKFNHPNMDIMNRWRSSGTSVFRTDRHGAVTIVSEENGFWVYTVAEFSQ